METNISRISEGVCSLKTLAERTFGAGREWSNPAVSKIIDIDSKGQYDIVRGRFKLGCQSEVSARSYFHK